MCGTTVEQGYVMELPGSDANSGKLSLFYAFVQFMSYSTVAKRKYFASRDLGKRIWQLSSTSFRFAIKSAVAVFFFFRPVRRITNGSQGLENENLKPSKY